MSSASFFGFTSPDFWKNHLENESQIAILQLDRQFCILNMNQGAQRLLGQTPHQGLELETWLETESMKNLLALPEGLHPKLLLNFDSLTHPAFALRCRVEITQDQVLIVGESPFYTQEDYLEQISALNGELINSSRNLLREKRQIQALKQETEGLNLQLQKYIQQQKSELIASVDLLEQGRMQIQDLRERAEIAQQAKAELARLKGISKPDLEPIKTCDETFKAQAKRAEECAKDLKGKQDDLKDKTPEPAWYERLGMHLGMS